MSINRLYLRGGMMHIYVYYIISYCRIVGNCEIINCPAKTKREQNKILMIITDLLRTLNNV